MFSKDLDSNVIHFYMQHLEKREGLKSIFFRSEAWVKIYFLLLKCIATNSGTATAATCDQGPNCDQGRSV